MVKHSEYLSIYRGVKKSLKSVGDYVPAGECIGIAGESQVGFELWKNDKIINPEEIIAF
jgi:septal ring factor EnvC (AmiA/AmiB activator)